MLGVRSFLCKPRSGDAQEPVFFFLPCIEQTGMDKDEDKRDYTLQSEVPRKVQVQMNITYICNNLITSFSFIQETRHCKEAVLKLSASDENWSGSW